MYILFFLLVILSGICYSLGGSGKQGKWYDFLLNTKTRDFGVPLVMIAAMSVLGWWHWTLVPSALLLFAALTTYWKKKGTNALWWNWYLTGMGYCLAMIPFLFDHWSIHLEGFLARLLILPLLTMAWSEYVSDPFWEQFGRGVLIILTLLFFNL